MRIAVAFEDCEKLEVLWSVGDESYAEWRQGFWYALIRNYHEWLNKGCGIYLFNMDDKTKQITRIDYITRIIESKKETC